MSWKAYTYFVRCIPTGECYYGVKWASKADPSRFWVDYFTSSKLVKERIHQYGKDAFHAEERRVFDSKEEALRWEARVLTRLKAAQRPDYLNRTNGNENWFNTGGWEMPEPNRKNLSDKMKGRLPVTKDGVTKRVWPEEIGTYLADGWRRGFHYDTGCTGKFKVRKDGVVLRIDPSELEQYLSEGWIRGDGNKATTGLAPAKGKISINRDGENRFIDPSEFEQYKADGWKRGTGRNDLAGKIRITDGTQTMHIKEDEPIPDGWWKGQGKTENFYSFFREKVSCPHCGKEGNAGIMRRWHFDRCKQKSKF